MDARATRRGIPAAVFWGGIGVLAWATLTVLLAGGSAHADEQDGPLDGLTSLASDTVSAVTAPVTPFVTQVVAPVVTQVVAPVQQAVPTVVATVTAPIVNAPVVGPAVAPVVHAATETATAVVTPVADVLTGAPVSQITDPILDTVADIPVVGGLASDLGLISAVGDVVGVVDDTTALLGNVADQTVPPVLEALDPTTPATPPTPEPGDGSGQITEPAASTVTGLVTERTATTPPATPTTNSAPGSPLSGSLPAVDRTAPRAVDHITPVPSGPPPGSPQGTTVPASSSAGSGGANGASPARLSDANSSPLRAGERTSGASDDELPSSPVADTDVSPD
ncbi:hypothetical protein [Microbacterium maritypicum]|uniref:hypothetical protein n=1 Tax=Microbacterium maritypicum TaxID=33918 RepID=UPI0038045BF7